MQHDTSQSLTEIDSDRDYYGGLANWMDTVAWYDDSHILQRVDELVPRHTTSCLELCCGTGRLGVYLAQRHRFVEHSLWDASQEMIRRAAEHARERNVLIKIRRGNWNEALHSVLPYDVVIVKNSLHVIDNLHDSLRLLSARSDSRTRLIVVETVSPTSEAREFISHLSNALGISAVKKRVFDSASLSLALLEAGWHELSGSQHLCQWIDVGDWMRHKAVSDLHLLAARKVFDRASSEVATAMQFQGAVSSEGVPEQMLRLQFIGVFMLGA